MRQKCTELEGHTLAEICSRVQIWNIPKREICSSFETANRKKRGWRKCKKAPDQWIQEMWNIDILSIQLKFIPNCPKTLMWWVREKPLVKQSKLDWNLIYTRQGGWLGTEVKKSMLKCGARKIDFLWCNATWEESERENQTLESKTSTSSTDSVIDLGSPPQPPTSIKSKRVTSKTLRSSNIDGWR